MVPLKFKRCSESFGLLKVNYWIQAENLYFNKFSGDGMLLVQEPQFGHHCLHNKFILLVVGEPRHLTAVFLFFRSNLMYQHAIFI